MHGLGAGLINDHDRYNQSQNPWSKVNVNIRRSGVWIRAEGGLEQGFGWVSVLLQNGWRRVGAGTDQGPRIAGLMLPLRTDC
jgi:hypothetical protein